MNVVMNVVWIEIPFNHEDINIPSSWLNKNGTLNPKKMNSDITTRMLENKKKTDEWQAIAILHSVPSN